MSLATEEIDSEQSGQQSLQQQLEKTNELVSVLTKQLAYMKEAVCLIVKYYFHVLIYFQKDGRTTKEATTQPSTYSTPQQTNTHAICRLLMKIKIYFVSYSWQNTPPSQRKETLHISLHIFFCTSKIV